MYAGLGTWMLQSGSICIASTVPCGHLLARTALHRMFRTFVQVF